MFTLGKRGLGKGGLGKRGLGKSGSTPVCELECVENWAPAENVNYYTQYQAKCIDDLEKDLILEGIRREISDEDLKKKLQGAVIKLYIGVNDENLDELCKLAYLPGWSIQKKS